MTQPNEDKRTKVERLLKECVESKRLRHETESAKQKAEQAYHLATETPRLPSPWPETAAYRLAHILLRRATTKDDLKRADALFKHASGSRGNPCRLYPFACIYRLAVLHRLLKDAPSGVERRSIEESIEESFYMAVSRMGHRSELPIPVRGDSLDPSRPDVLIQGGAFNLLELAAYFLGEDYRPLEGLAGPDPLAPPPKSAWVVVGRGLSHGNILVTEDFALEEVESLGRRYREAVLCRIRTRRPEGGWKLGSDREWKQVSDDQVRLIACLLKEPETNRKELAKRLEGGSDDALRQLIRRTKLGLKKLTRMEPDSIIPPRRNPLALAPGIQAFVAIPFKAISG
jgi:hypothetical protein